MSRTSVALAVAVLVSSLHQAAAVPVGAEREGAARPASAAIVRQVTVNPDGSFTPPTVRIHDGDTVEWTLSDRADAIVQSSALASIVPWTDCLPAKAWEPADVNNLAGPMPEGVSGIFTTGPYGDDHGFDVTDEACSDGSDPVAISPTPNTDGTFDRLCATGPLGATMVDTWASPDITGVHIRLLWNQIQPEADRFDFDDLARELDNAVRYGKLYSLSVKAGKYGTPDWIFSTPAPERTISRAQPRRSARGAVTRLRFRDAGDDAEGCGMEMYLGNPTEQAYQDLWGAMLTELAAFVKSRADWYRALAYIRLSGANLTTAENRLPNQCKPECEICNTEVWARAGYTPSGLYAFYEWQADTLAELFPEKTMSYQLIQAGFPRVSDSGCWMVGEDDDADTMCPAALPPLNVVVVPGTELLPGGTRQTTEIIDQLIDFHGTRFQVQHNGLGVEPESPADTCPNYGLHYWTVPPAGPEFASAGTGCPNHWVLDAQARMPVGQLGGYQTKNAHGVDSPETLDSTIRNAWNSSDAAYLEIYEQRLWEALRHEASGVVQSSGHTMGAWDEKMHTRRRNRLVAVTTVPDPFPSTYSYTFHRTPGSMGDQTIYYYNAGRCGPGNPTMGEIIIEPF
jgi:hypothetical protein